MNALLDRVRKNLSAQQSPVTGLTPRQIEQLQKRYADFSDQINDDGLLTDSVVKVTSLHSPRPYLHLMASNHFGDDNQWGSFWDQHRGGFSCVDTVLAGKMTSHLDSNYVPTAPQPQDVRDFYIHEDGAAYPLFPVAGYEESHYEQINCDYGLDWYRLNCQRNGIHAALRVLVHPERPMEIWQITLTNNSQQQRKFSWFSHVRVNVDSYPFYYFVPRVVCEGLYDKANQALVFVNHDMNNKHPRSAFFASAEGFDGFDMMSEVFEGNAGRSMIPAAVQQGQCFNSLGQQPYAGLIAAGQFNADLAPGQSQCWTLGFGKCSEDAQKREAALVDIQKNVLAHADDAFHELHEQWQDKITAHAINTPDTHINRYFNVWSKYQARNQSRFIRALDKIGYRDILQDIMGVIDFEAPYVRAKLLEALRFQYPDGRAVRQYEKHPGSGFDLRMYQDSVVWIPDTLTSYIKQTGDMGILDETVSYLHPETLEPCESGTVYDHACRAIRNLFDNTGYHGLCAIGYGDWNDSLSGIGGDQGVSVWLSCACVYAAGLMAELAEAIGKSDDAGEFRDNAQTLTERINQHAWDGQWYMYAINKQGHAIGSQQNLEGKIHLNVNTWALFTGIAHAAGREQQVLEAIQEHLATPMGHRLLSPPYTRQSREDVGRIADMMPGMFENGSIYTHGEAFFLHAMICRKQPDAWLDAIYQTLPSALIPDIVTGPPHQQSNFFVGPDHPAYGANLFSNFTGSTAWYRKTIERMIGIIPQYDHVFIDPILPSKWDTIDVTRRLRGSQLDITIKRGKAIGVTLDGEAMDDWQIPYDRLSQPRHTIGITIA